jgi:hypothetical protein
MIEGDYLLTATSRRQVEMLKNLIGQRALQSSMTQTFPQIACMFLPFSTGIAGFSVVF